jgi:hypothetical protein
VNGRELADAIADSVNSGIDVTEFQDGIGAEHNYLQRAAFRQVFKPGIVALAGTSYTDARNEREVEKAREIADSMGWDY